MPPHSDTSVGVIGVGLLGSGLTERLLSNHVRVNIYGRNRTKLESLEKRGAKIFNSPSLLADHSEYIITCVTNYDSLRDVLNGNNGVLYSSNKNVIIIDCTTITTKQSVNCADMINKKDGFTFLSVPVMGGPTDARKGELISLVSGNKDSFERAYPILEYFSKHIFYLGKIIGLSNIVKLALNLNIAIITLALSEGLVLANHSGIDSNLYLKILNLTKLKTGISERKGQMMIDHNYPPSFFLKNMLKDIDLVMEMSHNLGLVLPMTSISQQLFRAANKQEDRREMDYSVIYAFLEELNSGNRE
jgi:3-hydroxyisobutyrate dehydrogenase